MLDQKETESPWLRKNIDTFTRVISVLAIVAIFLRRCYLAGALGSAHVPPMSGGIVATVEVLVEMTALMGVPIFLLLWCRLAKWGYLAYPRFWDYALVLLLYVVAVGYLPPPHGRDVLHFGR